ncbi:hypothetical protein P4O66_020379 [Electrophorus voltai]|uniref:Uncharacterized protein n=1 Tax=Electrophorus voltai TaxID=2609070 RepID=A0AAD8ZS17_9TELE|nr:uncharacterized protein si:ch211-127m7.2 [Electrophorus electricus]KAK1804359.1 hypothetical protein P4O66_020379 [Electrophorus voltai]
MSAQRHLPSWMDGTDHHQPINNTIKKSEGGTNKGARKSCPRRIVYWMNEQELMETAIGILKNDNAKLDVACTVKTKETRRLTDAQERTCVSDVAEQETIPYGDTLVKNSSTARLPSTHGPVQPHSGSCRSEPEFEDNPHGRNSDLDALRLVREIFFK